MGCFEADIGKNSQGQDDLSAEHLVQQLGRAELKRYAKRLHRQPDRRIMAAILDRSSVDEIATSEGIEVHEVQAVIERAMAELRRGLR